MIDILGTATTLLLIITAIAFIASIIKLIEESQDKKELQGNILLFVTSLILSTYFVLVLKFLENSKWLNIRVP